MAIEKQVNVIISAVDQFSTKLTSFAGGLGGIAIAAVAAEAALVALGLGAAKLAVSIGQELLDSAKDFHDGAIDIVAVAQAAGTSLEDVNVILEDLTLRFPLTGKEAANAMELIAQMGFGSAESLAAASEAAVNLSMATGIDMQTSVKALTATMNAFNMGVEEAPRLMNLFAAAQFTSALTAADMADAIKYAGSMSKLTGQSVEGMTAALALLKNNGLEATQAATVMRMAMANLLKETSKGTIALAKYGLTYSDVNPSVHSFAEIIGKFKGQIVGAKDAVDIFGVRQLAFTTLVNGGREAFDRYRDSITGTSAGFDAVTAKMLKWDVVTANLGGSMDLLKKTLAGELLPSVVDFIGKDENSGLRGVITQFQKLEEDNPFGGIGKIVTDTFDTITGIGKDLFKEAFGDVEGLYDWVYKLFQFLQTNLVVITQVGAMLAEMFIGATDDGDNLKELLKFIKDAIFFLVSPIAAIHDAFTLFFYMIDAGAFGVKKGFASIMVSVNAVHLGMLKLAQAMGLGDFSKDIAEVEAKMKGWQEIMEKPFDTKPPERWLVKLTEMSVKAEETLNKFGEVAKKATDKVKEMVPPMEQVEVMAKKMGVGMEGVKDWAEAAANSEKELAYQAAIAATEIDKTKDAAKEVKEEVETTEQVYVGMIKTGKKAGQALYETVIKAKGGVKEVGEEVDKTNEKLSEWEKYELGLETAQFKHELKMAEDAAKLTGEILKKSLDIEAKLDLKKLDLAMKTIEGELKVQEKMWESIGNSVVAAADATSTMFGKLADFEGSMGARWKMEDMVEAQLEIQRVLAESQAELTKQQAAMMEQRAAILKDQRERARRDGGTQPISVSVVGNTTPWLKGLMDELFDEVFIRAQAEAFSCQCQTL